jgi:NADPH:quinone reductase-like Zn-dependent oxidoreductase
MKAVFYRSYGGPEALEYGEVEDPKVGPDSVLVDVRATSVNPVDWKIAAGYLDGMLNTHFPVIPGWDVAGVVAATGPAVPEFEPGDEVIGYVRMDAVGHGTFAEKVAAPVRALARKPQNVDWAQAATIPLAGLTAYQCLQQLAVGEGDTVLVHNGSGGVGTYAIQIARALGAKVLATASPKNHELLRGLGAEPVEYGEGIADRVRAAAPGGVNAVADFAGGQDWQQTLENLTDTGRLVSVVDTAVAEHGGQYVFVRPSPEDLLAITELVEAEKVKPVVADTLPLAKAADAFRLSMDGHTAGKIALTVTG